MANVHTYGLSHACVALTSLCTATGIETVLNKDHPSNPVDALLRILAIAGKRANKESLRVCSSRANRDALMAIKADMVIPISLKASH